VITGNTVTNSDNGLRIKSESFEVESRVELERTKLTRLDSFRFCSSAISGATGASVTGVTYTSNTVTAAAKYGVVIRKHTLCSKASKGRERSDSESLIRCFSLVRFCRARLLERRTHWKTYQRVSLLFHLLRLRNFKLNVFLLFPFFFFLSASPSRTSTSPLETRSPSDPRERRSTFCECNLPSKFCFVDASLPSLATRPSPSFFYHHN